MLANHTKWMNYAILQGLRSKGATTSEKSTISNSELNKVQAAVAVNNPSTIDDEECEACQ